MQSSEKDEILLAIQKLSDKVDIIPCIQQDIMKLQEDIKQLQETVSVIPSMQEDIKQLKEAIPSMQKDIKQLQETVSIIPSMQEDIRNISKSVAVIEVEHGEKLSLLFDIFDMHADKLTSEEKRIHLCEKHLEKHDDEIYYLKSEIQGLKNVV